MEIFKTKDGKTITYDNNRASVVDVKELLQQKSDIEERIIPTATDEELLAWAKENYQQTNHSVEIEELAKIDAQLESIKVIEVTK